MPQKRTHPKFSVVIPVYNSAATLEELHKRIAKTFDRQGQSFEIIFVDDSSADSSWSVLKKIASKDKSAKIVELFRNYGQHNALICGFSFTSGDFVVTMDDDLQHPPEEIPKLIKTIQKEEFDLVYGRYLQKEHGLIQNAGSAFVNYFIRKITRLKSNITAFRIIRKSVIEKVVQRKSYNVMIDLYLTDVVNERRIGYVQVRHDKRKTGRSNYSIRKLISFAVSLVLNFSTSPLKIASAFGLATSSISFLFAIFLLIRYFASQNHVSGWTSLILTVIFFSGIILFVLGIIGEYISRIFLTLANKPQYEIRESKL